MLVTTIVLIIIAAVLLMLVVLAQNSKGGMGAAFGGGGGSAQMGVKKTTDLLEKLTWGFAIAIMIMSVGYNVFAGGTNGPDRHYDVDRDILQNMGEGFNPDAGQTAPADGSPIETAPAESKPAEAPAQ